VQYPPQRANISFLEPVHLHFWQPIPSFHQEGFLNQLAEADWVDSLTLKYEGDIPAELKASGWPEPKWKCVNASIISDTDIPDAAANQVHFFTGFYTHKKIWQVFNRLPRSAKCRVFAFAEAPALYDWKAPLRRIKYRLNARRLECRLNGILALGERGVQFYRNLLDTACPVHQFAYYDLPLSDFPKAVTPHPHTITQLLYVGRLIHLKGLDRLFHSLAHLPQNCNGWQLTLVGGGPEERYLKTLANQLNIHDRIRWAGSVAAHQVATYYQNSDYLIQPSRSDGWGMTIPEALRHGCDVIATDACGAADLANPSQRLPKDTAHWPKILLTAIENGPLNDAQRSANRTRAEAICAEVGVARLKQIVHTTPP